jgi:two-component system nitrate/nitrite response regulator NarL
MPRIDVLIVDPNQFSSEGLRLLLLAEETYDVIGAASLGGALARVEAGGRSDLLVVVLDDFGETFQKATLQQVRAITPASKIVIITNTISSFVPARVSDWGVNALLLNGMPREGLIRSLRSVMQGQTIFPDLSLMRDDAPDLTEPVAFRLVSRISDSEGRVLRRLLAGCSDKMIARELAIGDAAVKMLMKALLRKLNVRNRIQAAIWALANGFSEKSEASLSAVLSRPAGIDQERGVDLAA